MDNGYVKTTKYKDKDLELYSISKDGKETIKGSCSKPSVCILPFDLNSSGKISNLYLKKEKDLYTGQNGLTLFGDTFNDYSDSDSYDAFLRCINSDLGISLDSSVISDSSCFYLGKVSQSYPVEKEYHCYGLDVSKLINSPSGFVPDIPNEEASMKSHSLSKMKFNRAIKGEVKDSLVLSSCMLLISYLS